MESLKLGYWRKPHKPNHYFYGFMKPRNRTEEQTTISLPSGHGERKYRNEQPNLHGERIIRDISLDQLRQLALLGINVPTTYTDFNAQVKLDKEEDEKTWSRVKF